MSENSLIRFGVSMEESLLESFDSLVATKKYNNRSEAVRDLVREALAKQQLEGDQEVVGSILFFYDHHQRNLMNELTNVQHDYHDCILATTHFHLDHDHCLEMIVVKGQASALQQLTDQLTSLKGVKYGKLTVSPLKGV